MNTLDYILNKYNLSLEKEKNYIEIPNVGRNDIPFLLHELNFKKLVEVGVQGGRYSVELAGKNPQAIVYGIDPWKAYVTHPAEDHLKTSQTNSSQERCDHFYRQTKKRLAPYLNYKIIKKISMEALDDFEDESLDFVYIDANHEYSFVMDDIKNWSKKVKPGGIMSGHDYYRVRNRGSLMEVKFAVDDWVKKEGIKPLIIWGANGVPPKIIKRDKRRSWSWII